MKWFIERLLFRWRCWRLGICHIHGENVWQGDVRGSWKECKTCTKEAEDKGQQEVDGFVKRHWR